MPLSTIPVTSGSLIAGASLAFALWSYIPLYILPVTIGGCLLKVLIEVRDRHQCPRWSSGLMGVYSRKGRLLRTLSLVMNTGYINSRSHIGLSRTSGERRLGVPRGYRYELGQFKSLRLFHAWLR